MLVAGLSPLRPPFIPILGHVGSVMDKLALTEVIRSIDYHPTSIFTPTIRTAMMGHVGLQR
jgi:hypothetical protein